MQMSSASSEGGSPGFSADHASAPSHGGAGLAAQYELLLRKLALAQRELETDGVIGRGGSLEEASGVVFDLLYALDFRRGGELVPRLAALYGYIGNELLNVGRTGDGAQLAHLRDMIRTLHESCAVEDGAQ